MPFTEEYDSLISQLFPEMGENSRIVTPLKGVRFNKVCIGKNVVINSDCLMMAAGGITIEDDVMIGIGRHADRLAEYSSKLPMII